MTPTPETPDLKPKGGFMGLLDQVKSAVSKVMPDDVKMDEIKHKIKSQAESVSAGISENIKKIDVEKISNTLKETINKVDIDKISYKIKNTVNTVRGKPADNDNKDEPK